MKELADDLNTLTNFLALRDLTDVTEDTLLEKYGLRELDSIILFGGSIPHGLDIAAKLFNSGIAKKLIIVGGIGHTTDHLRNEIHSAFPNIPVIHRSEAEIIAEYLTEAFAIPKEKMLLETQSTNCGENVQFILSLLKEHGEILNSTLIMQDATMQRRMSATFEKKWGKEPTKVINFAPYVPKLEVLDNQLHFSSQLWGMWSLEHYVQLLLGEMTRLTDDADGYGPTGKNFIVHVEIPEDVKLAFSRLTKEFPETSRPPWEA